MNDISVLNLFLEAGMVVKTVMMILLIASLLTWIVIVERYNFYKKIKLINDSFLERFWSGEDLNLLYSEIKTETVAAKKVLLESDAYQSKKDLATSFSRALATFRAKERQVFLEVKQQIILLVLNRTVTRAQETFGKTDRATALINDTINKLEGDVLWVKIL